MQFEPPDVTVHRNTYAWHMQFYSAPYVVPADEDLTCVGSTTERDVCEGPDRRSAIERDRQIGEEWEWFARKTRRWLASGQCTVELLGQKLSNCRAFDCSVMVAQRHCHQ